MPRCAGNKQRAAERGTILLMATVTILVVVGMLALSVDVGYLMNGRGQMQNIVDASALAGAQGLRTAIEPAGPPTQQNQIVRKLAKDFALFNPMRRADGVSGLVLDDIKDIRIEYPTDYPIQPARVIVKHRTALPTIFGNVFGIPSMDVSAVAIASTSVADGGTGFVSGCWRPILIPDTFYDLNDDPWAVSGPANFSDGTSSPSRPGTPEASQSGDYYVSRFASFNAESTRNQTTNFRQSVTTGTPVGAATGIRDAHNLGELKVSGGKNLIGQRIRLRKDDWRIVNFERSEITGDFPTNPIEQINRGCCAQIRVGQLVQVLTPDIENSGIYLNFIHQLQLYFDSFAATGDLMTNAGNQYKFAQTQNYPTPNANPRVIPVLMCSPIQFASRNTPQFYVTNIGAFFLEQVGTDGSITGAFVREMVAGGTPLEPQNEVPNMALLPVSVHLVR